MTVLKVQGLSRAEIIDMMGHMVYPKENSVYLCSKYLGLPGYAQMSAEFKKHQDLKRDIHNTNSFGDIS